MFLFSYPWISLRFLLIQLYAVSLFGNQVVYYPTALQLRSPPYPFMSIPSAFTEMLNRVIPLSLVHTLNNIQINYFFQELNRYSAYPNRFPTFLFYHAFNIINIVYFCLFLLLTIPFPRKLSSHSLSFLKLRKTLKYSLHHLFTSHQLPISVFYKLTHLLCTFSDAIYFSSDYYFLSKLF